MNGLYLFHTSQMTRSAKKISNKVRRDQKGSKGTKRCQKGPKWGPMQPEFKFISRKPLVLKTQSSPHFNHKDHVSICLSCIYYLSDDRKGSKMPKQGQNGQKRSLVAKRGPMEPESISCEPLVLKTWQNPHFNQKYHVSINVSYISHLSDNRKCYKNV